MNKMEIEVVWTTTLLLSWLGHTLALEIPGNLQIRERGAKDTEENMRKMS